MKTSMGIAALIMAISVLLSRFMGLIRDKVISWQFGIGAEADIYFTAFVIPDFINYLLAGGYLSITLIPFLAKKFEEERNNIDIKTSSKHKDSWSFFSTVFTWAGISITALTILAFAFADFLVQYIAPGFSYENQLRLAYFLRIILFAQVFFLLGACFSAILYIRREFLVPALMPLIYNGAILLFGIILPQFGLVHGMEGFCYGVLIGAFFGAFLLPYFAVKRKELDVHFSLKHSDFKKFLILAIPLMLGQSVVILDEQFVRIFGSLAGEGAVSLLNYARRIMLVPVGVVAQAGALASFPFLATLIAQNKESEFNSTLTTALNSSLILIVPVSAFMILQAENILGLIFEGGSFSADYTLQGSLLLQIMLLSVPFWAIQQIIGRAFYARQNTITPALVGSFATVCVLPLYMYLVPIYGAFIVSSITTFSLFIYTILLVLIWHKKYPSSLPIDMIKTFARACFLAIPSFFFAWYCTNKISPYINYNTLLTQRILEILISGFIFSITWLFFAWNLAKNDVLVLINPFLKKFHTRKSNGN